MMKHISLFLVIFLTGCASLPSMTDTRPVDGCSFLDEGLASWYGNEMAKGKRNGQYFFNPTASGEKFLPAGMTAAHRTLPFGTMVKVVLDAPDADPHGVVVRINDRGPFVHGRIIDLSAGAARKLGMPDTRRVKIYTCDT